MTRDRPRPDRRSPGDLRSRGPSLGDRAQSNVVGVALLLSITVIALGGLTAGVGTLVADHAASANAARVADGFDSALRPVETTGVHRGRVEFTSGELRVEERELVIEKRGRAYTDTVHVDALVYESGDRRVTFLAGAITRGTGRSSRLYRRPPITASRGSGGILVIGAPVLGDAVGGKSGSGTVTATLQTNVTHARESMETGRFNVTIETEATRAWHVAFERLGATAVTTKRGPDGDRRVEAAFSGRRDMYLVRHRMDLEVL